jgi:hypothetical protein
MTDRYDGELFWDTFAAAMFNERRVAAAAEEVGRIVKLIGVTAGQSILGSLLRYRPSLARVRSTRLRSNWG